MPMCRSDVQVPKRKRKHGRGKGIVEAENVGLR